MSTKTAKKKAADDCLGQEFIITREFDAPREMVFKAWTDPKQLAQWWGPRGFTNPVCEWDARGGGKIHVVMRAPGGAEYPMGGEIREVVPPEKLVFTTGALGETGKMMFEFLHTATFTVRGGKTKLTLQSRVIATTAGAGKYIGGFEAGMTQSLERLAELVAAGVENIAREIFVTRVFDAPRELVWEAWTNPKHVVNWWGPRGFSTTIEKTDFRVGGVRKYTMVGPDGAKYPNLQTFTEIVEPERIVCNHGGHREDGPAVAFVATWTFEALTPKQTRVSMRGLFPSAKERDFVVKEFGVIEGGKQTLERLAEYLVKLEKMPSRPAKKKR